MNGYGFQINEELQITHFNNKVLLNNMTILFLFFKFEDIEKRKISTGLSMCVLLSRFIFSQINLNERVNKFYVLYLVKGEPKLSNRVIIFMILCETIWLSFLIYDIFFFFFLPGTSIYFNFFEPLLFYYLLETKVDTSNKIS